MGTNATAAAYKASRFAAGALAIADVFGPRKEEVGNIPSGPDGIVLVVYWTRVVCILRYRKLTDVRLIFVLVYCFVWSSRFTSGSCFDCSVVRQLDTYSCELVFIGYQETASTGG